MSKSIAVLIKRIWQGDAYTLCIEWSDGQINHYRLKDLQKNCPCAACQEMSSAASHAVSDKVSAQRVVSVGRYALKVFFTTGCSHGIYDFDLLRKL